MEEYYKIIIKGIVQGVGFRPFVYREAVKKKYKGYVKNTGKGVEIIVNNKDFIIPILKNKPPLAKIDSYTIEKTKLKKKYEKFQIKKSKKTKGVSQLPPDIFLCKECLKELRNKKNRRYNYYFITCTNCGPRFSMIKDYPYDRPCTSMNEFVMCEECKKEYTNPLNRRYHAQTIACKNCGPKLKLIENKKDILGKTDIDTIKNAIAIIKSGDFISIKGVGGFHICTRIEKNSVEKVRNFLKRPNKPFAMMVRDIEMAEKLVEISEKEKKKLKSPERPIVVLKKKNPGLNYVSELDSIGIMLPYTALHYLIFDYIDEPLLMTSCNIPGEPVAITEKLGKTFLTHERKIVNRCDDSVLKIINNQTFYLRRSRGYTPVPVRLPIKCKDTIAVGAELNNVICTVKDKNCFLSQYIGQTYKLETFNYLKNTVSKFIRLTRLKPEIIVCDLHPEYNSTKLAIKLSEKYKAKLIQIQHHKAHVASVASEHNLKNYVGIAMDGLGYSEDGKIWGGEIFNIENSKKFTRIGHLQEQPQLGGDSATIYPKKMLFGILSKILSKKELLKLKLFNKKDTELYLKTLKQRFNTPLTTSTGRVLDAVAALLDLCEKRTYEGRPPMILESIASEPYDFEPVIKNKQILMTTPLFRFLCDNLNKDKKRLAATAQRYIAKGMYKIASKLNKPIVFSGGVAYNRMISGFMMKNNVLVNKNIPSGDGGICYGQAYLANC
jgi:hydrogenase maturation protein HypF